MNKIKTTEELIQEALEHAFDSCDDGDKNHVELDDIRQIWKITNEKAPIVSKDLMRDQDLNMWNDLTRELSDIIEQTTDKKNK